MPKAIDGRWPVTILQTIEYLGLRSVLATLAWTPMPVANALGGLYGKLAYLAARRARRTALFNLEMAGFQDRERILRGVFSSMGRMLVSFARFPRMSRRNLKSWVRYDGLENYERARERGQGVLVASAHLGNWELCAFAPSLLGSPVDLVARQLDNPLIDRLVERYRALAGNRIIEKRGALRPIARALRAGGTVAMLIDENTAREDGVFVDFFGVKACAGTALARMAHFTGAAVVPAYAVWMEEERRYVIRVESEVEMSGDAAQDTQRIQARIEAAIRKYPDQWLWIRKRWKTRPWGEAPSY